MHNVDSKLKLSYSPLTIFEFESYKTDKEIEQYLASISIYVIAKRPLPVMKIISANPSGFHIEVKMDGYDKCFEIIMTKQDNPKLFGNGLFAIRTGSNVINESEVFHSITLYRDVGDEDGEFILSANFDRLIHLMSNRIIQLRIKGDVTPFVSYEVLYVGQCVGEHIFHRFKAHHALQNILIKENIIPPNYDKVNDLLLLPFYIDSDVISVITGEANKDEFIEAMTGQFSFGGKEISLDCEKALIYAMNPKYNKTSFKQYPKSSDGLFNHKLDSYLYRIAENLVLCYGSDNKIYGDVQELDASIISIVDDKNFNIYQ